MKTLHLAKGLELPLDAVTQTFAILAKRGVGKTYTASVMAEEMLKAGQPIVALDPTGAWWGLRSEYPVVIIGGEHADIPLEVSAGEVIAQSIVENRFPAVIDLSLLRKGQMIQFMVAFAETLYRLNRDALHLFVDEADAFAPQAKNYGGDENRMLGAMEDIVRRGRKRGIGCTLITQRPAVLNKNVLTQCEVLISLRLVHPKDIDAIEEWVNVQADPRQAKEMISSLPSLPIGEAWFWSPGWGDFFKRVHVRQRETFDSGATPKAGETAKAPKTLAQIDVKTLGEQIQATVEKTKANDPSTLRRRITQLEAELAKKHPPAAATKVETKRVEVPILKDSQTNALERSAEKMNAAAAELAGAAKAVTAAIAEAKRLASPAPALPPRPPLMVKTPSLLRHVHDQVRAERAPAQTSARDAGDPNLNAGERKMLEVLCRMKVTRAQLGSLSGYSYTGGTFAKYFSHLKTLGYLVERGDTVEITDVGRGTVGDQLPAPQTTEEVLAMWRERLELGPRTMLDELVKVYPESMSRGGLGGMTGYAAAGGTFAKYLSILRRNNLVEVAGDDVRASPDLFIGAAA